MIRTYVDIVGEYYDNKNDIQEEAIQLGLRYYDLKKIFPRGKQRHKKKYMEE